MNQPRKMTKDPEQVSMTSSELNVFMAMTLGAVILAFCYLTLIDPQATAWWKQAIAWYFLLAGSMCLTLVHHARFVTGSLPSD